MLRRVRIWSIGVSCLNTTWKDSCTWWFSLVILSACQVPQWYWAILWCREVLLCIDTTRGKTNIIYQLLNPTQFNLFQFFDSFLGYFINYSSRNSVIHYLLIALRKFKHCAFHISSILKEVRWLVFDFILCTLLWLLLYLLTLPLP